MHPIIADNLDQIRALCRVHHVRSLFLVGSATGSSFSPGTSDVDFLVEFEPSVRGGFSHPYFHLSRALEDLLGRHVDLIMAGAIDNPFFAASVQKSKVPVYAAA